MPEGSQTPGNRVLDSKSRTIAPSRFDMAASPAYSAVTGHTLTDSQSGERVDTPCPPCYTQVDLGGRFPGANME